MKQGKVWGTTQPVYVSRHLQVHLLELEAGGFSSEHRHLAKANLFHVVSGRVEILVWPEPAGPADKTRLGPGESLAIRPGLFHQFRAIAPSLCIEVYEAADVAEDIERRTQGGHE